MRIRKLWKIDYEDILLGIFVIILLVVMWLPKQSEAAEKIMQLADGAGYLVLTEEPCSTPDRPDYKWNAYATQVGHETIRGCWQNSGNMVSVIFPDDIHTYEFTQRVFTDSTQSN